MEQETEAIASDVSVLEGFMKVQAVGAVAECYCEHAVIAAFCEDAEIESVFTESDDSIGKKALGSIKAWFLHIIEWFKAIVKGIISFFTSKKIDRVIEGLKKAKKEGIQNLDIGNAKSYLDPGDIYAKIEKFKGIIDKISETANSAAVKTAIDALSKDLEEYIKNGKKSVAKERFDSSAKTSSNIDTVITELEQIQSRGPAKSGKELLKKLNYNPKEAKTADNQGVDKETNKAIKKLAGQLAKAYDKYCGATVKLVDKALGKAERDQALSDLQQNAASRKTAAEGRKNSTFFPASEEESETPETTPEKPEGESYVENSDGYFFL
jgi:hypothetical protein